MYRQLEGQLRAAILDGLLPPGTRLPSVRELAQQLGVARVTITTAYDQLTAEGYLIGRTGAGTRIAAHLPEDALHLRASRRTQSAQRRPARANLPSTVLRDVTVPHPMPVSRIRYDMEAGGVGLDLIPHDVWAKLLAEAYRELAANDRSLRLGYADPAGDPMLRDALVAYLAAARGVRCTAAQVVITRGAQGAFGAVAAAWLDEQRSFVVEDPGYPNARMALASTGARPVPVAVDDHGLRTDLLPDGPSIAMVTPSWQHPMGGTLPIARRLELLTWAERQEALVVEDDYDSELRYVGHPITSLQGLDEGGRVLYVGTFSKAMYPALRIGYMVAPEQALQPILAAMSMAGRPPGAVEQRAMAHFITRGHFERHLRRLRVAYAERQAVLLDSLRREFGDLVEVQPAAAGMHVVLKLDASLPRASTIARGAASAGLIVSPIEDHRVRPGPDDRLMLSYTSLRPLDMRVAVRLLGEVMRGAADRRSVGPRPR